MNKKAQIGHGYGSEFQLLRFLGHHRHELERIISDTIGEYGIFDWLDFGYADQRVVISGDEEIKGLNFLSSILPENIFDEIIAEYHNYKIGNIDIWQNWDAVFVLNECIYFVEAKAHVSEISSDNEDHGGNSMKEILRFFKDQLPHLKVNAEWLREYYQLANRLATTALLIKHGVKAKTLYIYFENGFNKKTAPDNAIKVDYEKALSKEMKALGITNDDVRELLTPAIFIDANPF